MENKSIDIDLRMFLIYALATNNYLHEDIDKIYENNRQEYFKIYKESVYYDCPLFDVTPTHIRERIKKVVGIVGKEYIEKAVDENNSIIFKLIKKGYKFTYRYVRDRNSIYFAEYMMAVEKQYKGIENITDMQLANFITICYYVALSQGKEIEVGDDTQDVIRRVYTIPMTNSVQKEINYNKKRLEATKEEVQEYIKKINIPNMNKNEILDNYFDRIIEMEVEELARSYNTSKSLFDTRTYFNARDNVFKKGRFSRIIGSLSGYLKVMGIDDTIFFNDVFLNGEDMQTLNTAIWDYKNANAITDEEIPMLYFSFIYFTGLGKEYKKTQEKYLKEAEEIMTYEIEKVKENLKVKEDILLKKEEELEKNNSSLKSKLEESSIVISDLKKENIKLSKEKDYIEKNNKELIAFRELFFEESKEYVHEESKTEEINKYLDHIKAIKRITIIGGSPSWVNKMKEVLTNARFVSLDSKNMDLSFLDNDDVVLVNTAFQSHAMYYKVMARMNRNNTPMHFINANNNINIAIRYIYNVIK